MKIERERGGGLSLLEGNAWNIAVTIDTFGQTDLALFFLSASYLIVTRDNLITRYTIF